MYDLHACTCIVKFAPHHSPDQWGHAGPALSPLGTLSPRVANVLIVPLVFAEPFTLTHEPEVITVHLSPAAMASVQLRPSGQAEARSEPGFGRALTNIGLCAPLPSPAPPCTWPQPPAPASVATARTTALATSDHRHHALAPGAVRRAQDTRTSPATKRQSPPADLGQAKQETVQACKVPYPQVLPVVKPTTSAAAQDQTKGAYDRAPHLELRYVPGPKGRQLLVFVGKTETPTVALQSVGRASHTLCLDWNL